MLTTVLSDTDAPTPAVKMASERINTANTVCMRMSICLPRYNICCCQISELLFIFVVSQNKRIWRCFERLGIDMYNIDAKDEISHYRYANSRIKDII